MRQGDIVVDRFEIDEVAGAGGMGQVFRARDRSTGEPVAVKVLLGDIASHAARFVHETRALSELSHPGIVRYVAHGISDSGEPYLAMEWLDGEDLSGRLDRAGLTIDESIELASRVAEALGAAHARGIVHRDLKPSNIFLVGRRIEQVKVLDFGIARLAGATRVTRTGNIIGTPGYMAPEQAQNDRVVDARADVFSLGCVLFECLTGAPAFAGEHLMALMAKVLFTDPPRLRELRPRPWCRDDNVAVRDDNVAVQGGGSFKDESA
jgi:serine/threonine protein kinase